MANRIETSLYIKGLSGDSNALQVLGNSILSGKTADSSSSALKVQNSGGTEILNVRNDGKILLQTLTAGLGGGNVSTNTAFGTSALNSNTTGFQNTSIGNNSLYTNTTPSGNTAVGHGALYLNGGSGGGYDNTAIGNEAMVLNNTATANYNTAVGSLALRSNTSGWDNTAVGYKAGNNTDIPYGSNSIGRHNTWVGWKAASVGSALDDVYYTTVVGWSGNVRGTGAVSIGANSVVYSANSVSLGYSNSVNGTNSIAIGSNVNIYADNTMVLGNGVNVGIGTVSPSEKLEISGNTKLSSLSNSYNIGSYTAIKMSQGVGASNISLGHSNTLNDSGNGGAIAIGQSVTSSDDGIAIGLFSTVAAGTTDGIAIGRSATVNNSSIRGIAIGRDSLVSANNAFAIGNYTTAYQDNTIIIGNNSSGSKPNVGIGTSSPSSKLHVSAATNDVVYNLRLQNSSNGTQSGVALVVENDSNLAGEFGMLGSTHSVFTGYGNPNDVFVRSSASAANLNLIAGNSGQAITMSIGGAQLPTMTIKSGVVGIGTFAGTPQERLHISGGTIRINTANGTEGAGKLAVSDANGSISFSSTTALGLGSGFGTVGGTGTTNYITKWNSSTAITDSIIFDNGTNVGIGTSSPTSKFHVMSTLNDGIKTESIQSGHYILASPGNNSFGPNITSSYALELKTPSAEIRLGRTGGTGNALIYVDSTITTGLNISANAGGSPNLTLLSDGNVGAGTSSPLEKIHISNGTIRINDTGSTYGAGKLAVSDANGSISFSSTTALGLGAGSVNKYTTSTAFTAGIANYINHNLGLASATDAIVQIWSGNSLTLGGEVSAVTTNQISVTMSVTGTYKIVVMG